MADRARIPGEMVVVGSRRGPEGRVEVEADSFDVDRPELNGLPTEAQLQSRAERPAELLDEIAWIGRLWSRAYEAEKLGEAEIEAEERGEVLTEEEKEAAIPDQRLVVYQTQKNAGYVFRTEFGSSPKSREGIGPAQSSEKITTTVEVDGDGHFWIVELTEFYDEDHRKRSAMPHTEAKKKLDYGMTYMKTGEHKRQTPLTETEALDVFTVPETDDPQGYEQQKLTKTLEKAYGKIVGFTMGHIKTKEDRDQLLELVDFVYRSGGHWEDEDYLGYEEELRAREEEEEDDA